MSAPNTVNIQIAGGISVTVPASPQRMTTYILMEQQDWFEDEIKFIRFFIKPGMKIVDIGANYGCYTLSIADITGDSGRVWAIEPTEATASCLRDSIRLNNFNNIELIQAGLSIKPGHAKLFTSENSELNSLSSDVTDGNQHETIKLFTLDQCWKDYGWDDIDFIKLDAEGEEINILKGGKTMLASMSPLIMFELKHGDKINIPLIQQFNQMGYSCYRLIPGLNTLTSFDFTKPFDTFLLNLFCCKEDRACQLEETGMITRQHEARERPGHDVAWKHIRSLSYAKHIYQAQKTAIKDNTGEYMDILSAYIMALSESGSSQVRLACMMEALDKLRAMVAHGEKDSLRLVTFSRIAFDAGDQDFGSALLNGLIEKHAAGIRFKLDEPFLPASSRYEAIDPGEKTSEWLMSSILEQFILKSAYSTFFTRQHSLPLFEGLQRLGFMNEAMQRRHQLVQNCFSQQD